MARAYQFVLSVTLLLLVGADLAITGNQLPSEGLRARRIKALNYGDALIVLRLLSVAKSLRSFRTKTRKGLVKGLRSLGRPHLKSRSKS